MVTGDVGLSSGPCPQARKELRGGGHVDKLPVVRPREGTASCEDRWVQEGMPGGGAMR